jgi:hypothetical protein
MTYPTFPGIVLNVSEFSRLFRKIRNSSKTRRRLIHSGNESDMVYCDHCCDLSLNIFRKVMGDETDFRGSKRPYKPSKLW